MDLASSFYAHLCQQYPGLRNELKHDHISPQLLSPYTVQLSIKHREKIKKVIQAFNQLFESPTYLDWCLSNPQAPKRIGNRGLFMSYDFHITPQGDLKLIEINTNASFLGLGYEFSRMKGLSWNVDFKIEDLHQCLINEMRLASLEPKLSKVLITDEAPQNQKLYAEFLVFRELFRSWELNSEIVDVADVSACDLIYNRSTDFYFTDDKSKKLKDLYENRLAVVSPQPFEYFACADKENFIHWTQDNFWQKIQLADDDKNLILDSLPKTIAFSKSNQDQIWANRKNLFFKPKNLYGSKMSYKGASVSKRVFEELLQSDALAQELIPPSEIQVADQSYKYDLRCYAYRGEFQGCMARLYQGQVTNLKTPGGGFSSVLFS